jgi:CheY-like chemotaxis protein
MLRVLVVDDDADTTETMRLLLEVWGNEVAVARDGAAAVRSAVHFRPDVVLLDLALGPGPDGYEVARQIRRRAGNAPVIVCVSGYGQAEHRRRSREAGCHCHLLKPAEPDALARLLRAVAARGAPGRGAAPRAAWEGNPAPEREPEGVRQRESPGRGSGRPGA